MIASSPSRLAFLAGLGAVALLAGACGPNANQKALQGTLVTLNAARDGFTTWDADHQQVIVAQAPSLDAGQHALLAYRTGRERVVLGFEIAYQSLATAALDPSNTNLTTVLTAIVDVERKVEALGAVWLKKAVR